MPYLPLARRFCPQESKKSQCVPTITLPYNSIDACLIPLTKTNENQRSPLVGRPSRSDELHGGSAEFDAHHTAVVL